MAAWTDGWKLIRNLRDDSEELYRIERDPNERRNLAGSSAPEVLAALETLRRSIDEFESMEQNSAAALDLSREEIEHLRALGYLQ